MKDACNDAVKTCIKCGLEIIETQGWNAAVAPEFYRCRRCRVGAAYINTGSDDDGSVDAETLAMMAGEDVNYMKGVLKKHYPGVDRFNSKIQSAVMDAAALIDIGGNQ